MKIRYQLLLALLVGALVWPAQAQAQQPGDPGVHIVNCHDEDGLPVLNALRDAIMEDTDRPENRVYWIANGSYCWNVDRIVNDGFHLRIVGEQPGNTIETAPAVIQMVADAEGNVDARMIEGLDSITLRNLWITGATGAGEQDAYQPIQIDASNRTFLFENNVFERTNFALIAFTAPGNTITYRDNHFRNLVGFPSSQVWEGRAISIWADQESVVVENNTFFNIGMTILQIEGGSADYVRFNHNTIVNLGRNLNAGGWWQEAYFTNNLIVNGFWHGESPAQINDPNRNPEAYTAGMFSIGALPAQYGANIGRQILFANNATWRNPQFEAFYASDNFRAQPYANLITTRYFNTWDGMVARDTLWLDSRPNFETDLSGLVPLQIQNIRDLTAGRVPAADYRYGLVPEEEGGALAIRWPLPESFTYSQPAHLLTAGTDGLPLGDLNWFPEAKANFEANRDQYVRQIEAMTEAPEITPLFIVEAEHGALSGAAEIQVPEGETYFQMEGGGFIEWTFEVEQAGTYGFDIHTRSNDAERGQRVILNGTNLRNNQNYGEFYFAGLDPQEWRTYEVRQGELYEGGAALDLEPGTHTLRLEPSWGWQAFRSVDVVDAAGNVVEELTAPFARYQVVNPVCVGVDWCPQGFQAVDLGPGGAITWNIDVPHTGQFLVNIAYLAVDADAVVDIQVGDQVVETGFNLVGGAGAGANRMTPAITMNEGTRALTITAPTGGVVIDYIQLLSVGAGVSNEPGAMPEGFGLAQNYPNPFNGRTMIQYDLGTTSAVTLNVYDMLGRRVATLVDAVQPAGQHTVQLEANGLASGTYIYRLQTPVGMQTRRMTVVN